MPVLPISSTKKHFKIKLLKNRYRKKANVKRSRWLSDYSIRTFESNRRSQIFQTKADLSEEQFKKILQLNESDKKIPIEVEDEINLSS